jgi:hypothetical protein
MQANKVQAQKIKYREAATRGAYPIKNIHVSSNARVEVTESGAWVHLQVWIPAQEAK